MNALIEFLTAAPIPLFAGVLSCVSSILLSFVTKSIQKRIKKDEDANVKIKVNGQEMTIKGYSTEELLELLSKLEVKDQTLNQEEKDTPIVSKDQTPNQSEEDTI